jgi:hypothetical protein
MTSRSNKAQNLLPAAIANTGAKCPFTDRFDPTTVEVSGTVPEGARGLLALATAQDERIKKLILEIQTAKTLRTSARMMATAIMVENDPRLADRDGFLLAEDWTYFAEGVSKERQAEHLQGELFEERLDLEQQRKATGDDPEISSFLNGPDLISMIMGADHPFGRMGLRPTRSHVG